MKLFQERFSPAMMELMAVQADEEVVQGVTGGTSWKSTRGASADGSSNWYSLSMVFNENSGDAAEDEFWEVKRDLDESPAQPFISSNWPLPDAVTRHHPRRLACMIITGVLAGSMIGILAYAVVAVYKAINPAGTGSSSISQPLLAPLSKDETSSPVVVAADHADLEKHYVNIAYVPLRGE